MTYEIKINLLITEMYFRVFKLLEYNNVAMKQTILIVEDNAEIRDFLKKLMTAHNFDVQVAVDGAQALEIVEKTLPDLVLLDLKLPKISGETVCVEIKKNHPNIVVIVLSAKSNTSDVVHGLQIGADDYVQKPFVAEELIARIQSHLKEETNKSIARESTSSDLKKITLRESFVLTTIRLLIAELLFGGVVFLVVLFISFLTPHVGIVDIFPLYFLLFVLLFLFDSFLILSIILKWHFEYIDVAKEGITKHSGILHKTEQKYVCRFIETITFNQSLFGTIFNYGTLELYDPSLKEQIYLTNISKPRQYKEQIEKILPNNLNQQMLFMSK